MCDLWVLGLNYTEPTVGVLSSSPPLYLFISPLVPFSFICIDVSNLLLSFSVNLVLLRLLVLFRPLVLNRVWSWYGQTYWSFRFNLASVTVETEASSECHRQPLGVHTDSSANREPSKTHLFSQFPPRGKWKQSFSILSLFCLDLWPLTATTTLVAEKQFNRFYCFIVYNTRKSRHLSCTLLNLNWTLSHYGRRQIQSRVCFFSFVTLEAGIDWMSSWLEFSLALLQTKSSLIKLNNV